MATVKFSTGQSVNFNKTPTSQDIEEVAQKLGLNQSQSNTQPQSSAAQTNQPGLGAFGGNQSIQQPTQTPTQTTQPESFGQKVGNVAKGAYGCLIGIYASPVIY